MQHDAVAVVDQGIRLAVTIEVARVDLQETSLCLGVIQRLHVGIAHRAIRREIGPHSTIDYRSVYAPRDCSPALEQSDTLVVVPIGRPGPLCVVRALAYPRGDWASWFHEPRPFQGCAVSVDRVVDASRLPTHVSGIRLAILIAEPAQAVAEFMSDRVPGDPARQNA